MWPGARRFGILLILIRLKERHIDDKALRAAQHGQGDLVADAELLDDRHHVLRALRS